MMVDSSILPSETLFSFVVSKVPDRASGGNLGVFAGEKVGIIIIDKSLKVITLVRATRLARA